MAGDAQWIESMPEMYDRCLGPTLFAPYAVHVAESVVELAPARVLELAAGTGIVTRELVRVLPAAQITATDLNPAMVAWGAAQVPGADWQVADALDLSFPAEWFDLVVCQFGVMFFPDRPRAFAEMARVLAPDGWVRFAVWDVVEGSEVTAALVASLATLFPDDPPSFIVRVPHGYTDPDVINADVIAGGLVPLGIERVQLRGRSDSAATAAEGFCLGSPLRFELEQRGSLPELTAALSAEMTARLGYGPVEGNLAALIVTARRPG
jgi:SAM-dependent methyltransferase